MAEKKKILMLCDHPLSTSGVGTQARWMINGLVKTGKYSFRVFGGAVKHDDYRTTVVNEDFVIKPTNGFGDRQSLRQAIATEQPDCLLLFTDPRFFVWAWEMEDEIHQICPIAYNHLWDNPPWPEFNRVLYESTDMINCINHPTYEMVHERFPDKTNYIPHAVPDDLFKRLPDEQIKAARRQVLGEKNMNNFVALYVSRNARRKMPNDVLESWRIFLDDLEKEHGHRNATLVMHTDPRDPEGPNLFSVVELLGLRDHVAFSKDRVGFDDINALYNAADVIVNRSCNEGFGLSILEGKMTGTPAIAIKTGGMTRQVEDHLTGQQYGVALEPEVRSLVGNQMVPYIFEDFVSHKTFAAALMKMFNLPQNEREELSKACQAHAARDYNMKSLVETWDQTLTKLMETWSVDKHPRWRHKEL